MLAVPLNDTPPIVLAVSSAVAVSALPVKLVAVNVPLIVTLLNEDDPVLAVTLPVSPPENSFAVTVPVVVNVLVEETACAVSGCATVTPALSTVTTAVPAESAKTMLPSAPLPAPAAQFPAPAAASAPLPMATQTNVEGSIL